MPDWGITKQEKYLIIFLISSFVVGAGIRYYKINFIEYPDPRIVNYSRLDSLRQEFIKQSQVAALKAESKEKANTKSRIASYPVVNINSANKYELTALPRIGPVLAERILEYREKNGGFKKKQEIQKVKGIGKKIYKELKAYITVN